MRRIALMTAIVLWLVTLPLPANSQTVGGYEPTLRWGKDHAVAISESKAQNKPVLINFTGTDWCGPCIRLQSEVFQTAEFEAFARDRLILLDVQFLKLFPQSEAEKKTNEALAKQYRVEGFPTLFVVNPQGRVVARLGYMAGGPKPFLAELSKYVPAPPPGNGGWIVGQAEPEPFKPSVPAPAPAPAPVLVPAPKVTYDKLILKGITGSAKSPLALINGKTFSAGDSYKLQAGTNTFKVTCVSIATDHAVVQVEGEPGTRQLFLGVK